MMQWEAQRRGTVTGEGGEVAQLRIRFELEGEGVKTERDEFRSTPVSQFPT